MPAIKVNYHKCTGCRKCYELCPMDVYVWDEEMNLPKYYREPECWLCGICYLTCPKRAIDITLPIGLW